MQETLQLRMNQFFLLFLNSQAFSIFISFPLTGMVRGKLAEAFFYSNLCKIFNLHSYNSFSVLPLFCFFIWSAYLTLTLVQSLSSHRRSGQHIQSSLSGHLHPGRTSSLTPSPPRRSNHPIHSRFILLLQKDKKIFYTGNN